MQPQLLRSCGTGLAVVAALSVLFHSNAASAADTDLSQQHHAVNAVFGELYYSTSLWYIVQQYSTTIERSTSSLPVHACAQHCMCGGADHPTTGSKCHCTTVYLGSHQRIATLLLSADLAAGGEEDFWGNVGAYIRFFFTVLLGTANVASQPFRKVSHAAAHSPCCLDAMSAAGFEPSTRGHARPPPLVCVPNPAACCCKSDMCTIHCRQQSGLRQRLPWWLGALCCSPSWRSL
jgi:Protein of unknown function (DUF751)